MEKSSTSLNFDRLCCLSATSLRAPLTISPDVLSAVLGLGSRGVSAEQIVKRTGATPLQVAFYLRAVGFRKRLRLPYRTPSKRNRR